MKKFTERDKTLAMLLPAFIILLVYGFFVLRGKAGDLDRTQKALEKTKPPSPAEVAGKRGETIRLVQETQAIQAKLESLQKKWGYETSFCVTGAQRHDRVEKLTSLLNKYQLISMEDAEADAGGKDTKLSPSLESMIKKIAHLSNAQKPQLRRIRFYGRFVDVHDVVEELASGPVLAIPVGLSMKSTIHPELREWTLLVWL